jgi:hypothetical protein
VSEWSIEYDRLVKGWEIVRIEDRPLEYQVAVYCRHGKSTEVQVVWMKYTVVSQIAELLAKPVDRVIQSTRVSRRQQVTEQIAKLSAELAALKAEEVAK